MSSRRGRHWRRRPKRCIASPCFVESESCSGVGLEPPRCWPVHIEYEFDPARETRSTVRVRGDTPDGAADFAHLVTDVFLDLPPRNAMRAASSKRSKAFPQPHRRPRRCEAEEARQLYNEFRERHGISHLPSEQRSTVNSAAQLRVRQPIRRGRSPRSEGPDSDLGRAARQDAQDEHGCGRCVAGERSVQSPPQ